MNKDWSEMNKKLQSLLKRKDTFREGMDVLICLRNQLMQTMDSFRDSLSPEDLCAMPFPNGQGYHSKTIAYSLWHIFRIEDMVAHTLIKADTQVLFSGGYLESTGSPIITTGNELSGEQIADFSRSLNLDGLYAYAHAVKQSTEEILMQLAYESLKQRVTEQARAELERLNTVSREESAHWLIDYWCGKDVRGLIQMPFSRHWIMHTEACQRICGRLS